jgi:hypothetical protein
MDTEPTPQEAGQANVRCDGCGSSGPWLATGERWALLHLGDSDALYFGTGGTKVLTHIY